MFAADGVESAVCSSVAQGSAAQRITGATTAFDDMPHTATEQDDGVLLAGICSENCLVIHTKFPVCTHCNPQITNYHGESGWGRMTLRAEVISHVALMPNADDSTSYNVVGF